MTPSMTPPTTDHAPTTAASWQTAPDGEITGEITTLATRGGDQPRIALATEDGGFWLLDDTGNILARTDAGVDFATAVALHPARDEVTVTGARGYALLQPDQHTASKPSPGPALASRPDPVIYPTGWSSAAAYNTAGDLAVAAGRQIRIHRDPTRAPFTSAPLPSTVTGIAWTPGGRVAASAYGGVYSYEGQSSEPVQTYPYTGSHLTVAAHPNGTWVCSGNQDASVHIWRTADSDELEMAGYPSKVTLAAFDETGHWFANNGAPELTVWDFTGKGPRGRKPRLLKGHNQIVDLAWRPGASQMLASVGSEGSARIWNLAGMAAGRTRGAAKTLPYDDALRVRWLDADRLVVARAAGVLNLITWPIR